MLTLVCDPMIMGSISIFCSLVNNSYSMHLYFNILVMQHKSPCSKLVGLAPIFS